MLRGRGGSERGGVAITVALSMTVLLGFAALVVDIGLNWAARTSAQTAADSAALGGASRLLTDGGAAAVLTVQDLLDDNVGGLALPAGWATDGVEGNGEVVCWLLTDPQPGLGAGCPDGANALQVITPPIQVRYVFAPLLGQRANSIKARAAAGAGPAAPNNCVLCMLDPDDDLGLFSLGTGGIDVTGGGIVVNSDDDEALVVPGAGNITADQIRVVGGVDITGGLLVPAAELGGPPALDPLADLPTPDQLASPPTPVATPVQNITTATTLGPGVYDSINVTSTGRLTLQEGVYVVTEDEGFRIQPGGRVVGSGDGATIYLACSGYPAPCDGDDGAGFRLDNNGQFLVAPPAIGDEYAGLSIFADRGNTTATIVAGDLHLTGALYAASSRLRVGAFSALQVDALVVVDRLRAANNLDPMQVNYDPSLPLPGTGRPVLIR